MAYFTRTDLAYDYALAEACTICDAYYCSVLSGTYPNRLYQLTGTIDPQGAGGGPATNNFVPPDGFTWITYPERLQSSGITWKVYQQDSWGGNPLAFFSQYIQAKPGNPLYDRGMVLVPSIVAAFGAESDIDSNGVVLILLTPKVNALVTRPDCQTSYVTGFFFGADIDPSFRAQYNNGEVFYGMVPDSLGSVSCAYSPNLVRQLITVTFIHEFQHMISFNQHVLLRGGSLRGGN